MARQAVQSTTTLAAYARGVALFRKGSYQSALAELAALDGQDDLVGRIARFYRGMCNRAMGIEAMEDGHFDLAQRHLRAAMAEVGRHAEIGALLASLFARSGQPERCRAAMEKLAAQLPPSVETARRLALAQWSSGRRPEALMTLEKAMRTTPHPALNRQLGLLHAAEDRLDQAAEHLRQAVSADASDADAHYHLAMVHLAEGKPAPAVRSLQRTFQLRPGDLLVAYQLSLAARAAGAGGFHVMVNLPERSTSPPDEGSHIRQLSRYITDEPDLLEALLELPPSEADFDLMGMLLSVVETALAEHPHYADLHYYCGRILARLGRGDEATEAARRAVAINQRYVKALLLLGRLYQQQGAAEEAVENLERAIACGADYPDVHFEAAALLRTMKPAAARAHLQRALELNDCYQPAAEALASLAA
jgi:tetratricopeptide (TPR) repeat protein